MIKRLSERFFRWYCNPDFYEDIKGDLNELFRRQSAHYSERKAEWIFAKEVLLLFRPTIIRPFQFFQFLNLIDMIQNYFKIGMRNLRKHPSYTFIHILGLALGLTAFLFIENYRSFEKSYDRFHESPEQLYRLTTDDVKDGRIQVRDAMSFAPSGKVLVEEVPEIIGHTTTYKTRRMVFRKNGQPVEEQNVIAVDSNYLNLFNYRILRGDKKSMLNQPNAIVLTESLAQKYFENQDPIGKTIDVLGRFNQPFLVTGLLEDTPKNTHYSFDMLVSLKSFEERIKRDGWNGFNYYTYLKLDKNADLEKVQSMMPALTKKYLNDETRLVFNLQPVADIHLHSDFTFEPEIHGSAKAVYFLGVISIFILLIAWVNYINLSTARAMERAKEVGLRKVVGARKKQLMGQFLTESLLINFLGAVVALALAQFMLPYFNELVGKNVLTDIWSNPEFIKKLFLFFLLGTVVTGFYPALVLSSFRPIGVLKGSFGRTKKGAFLRKTLVVVQFAASLILIASTVIIYQQIRYMTNKDLGIDTEQVIGFQNARQPNLEEDQIISKYRAFMEEINRLEGVQKVAGISNLPGGGSSDISSTSGGVKVVGKTERVESTVYINGMNEWLVDALGLKLISGRKFDRELAVDTSAVMVNQAMLDLWGINDSEAVINEYLQFGRDPENDKFLIVGVIDNFNRSTLKNNIEPTVFFHNETPRNTVVKLNAENLTANLDGVKNVWNKFFPESPFVHTFIDSRFEKLYLEDKKFGFIFLNFALLAIFVASMGLFGLSSYMSMQRTKEVGIRKVLGASVSNIVLLFFKDFLWLILIAIIIGIPLIYFSMTDWLNGYAFRIDFPWWVLSLAVVSVVALAFFTVSFQTWKLALLNPSKTIRHE
ncbi:MAG: FtsX-like permease family protein [Bacteroidota bacterium]